MTRHTSQSPDAANGQTRPRKVKMPTSFNPACVFMAHSSKAVLSRVKANLSKLLESDQLQPRGHAVELIQWKNKFCAEVLEVCTVEVVQIAEMTLSEPAAPPTLSNAETESQSKLNMYMVLFGRPAGLEKTEAMLSLFNSVQQVALAGLNQGYSS